MDENNDRLRYRGSLALLIICALLLTVRIVYLMLTDATRFPVSTVKITASYQHITRKELEKVLANYLTYSFFSLPLPALRHDLAAMPWMDDVQIERIWPDTLKIVLQERIPVAHWNNALITAKAHVFRGNEALIETSLPFLFGPDQQKKDVLQNYQKLSKLLSSYGLHIASLRLQNTQAWEMTLTNGMQLHLGDRALNERLLRFCKAYPAVFADKPERVTYVDLRYARGMAVQWKTDGEENGKKS